MTEKLIFLAVDDDFVSRKLMASILKQYSKEIEIIEAENGEEALQIVEEYEEEISLILLDMNMPKLNGIGFLNAIPEDVFIPIIVLTTDESKKSEALDAGASDFMMKPVNNIKLIEKIKDYLD
jgi:putative two-component system response regulator